MPTPIDYRHRWRHAHLPRRTWDQGLDTITPYDADSTRALDAARRFVDTITDRLPTTQTTALLGHGLLLVGYPGTGKTTLACATLTDVHKIHDVDIRFVAAAAYIKVLAEYPRLDRAAATGDPDAARRLQAIDQARRIVRHRPLVLLDDVGKEHHTASNFARDEINQLLRGRWEDGLPTILTSNLPVSRWGADYDPSLESLLGEAYTLLAFNGADQRERAVA